MVERMVEGVATWHEKGVWSMRQYGAVKELNKALKQSLSLTRDLLLHWGPAPHTRAPQVSCFSAATIPVAWGSHTTCLQQHCP